MLGEVLVDGETKRLLEEAHCIVWMEADLSGNFLDANFFLIVLRDMSGQLLRLAEASFSKESLRTELPLRASVRRQRCRQPEQAGMKFEKRSRAILVSLPIEFRIQEFIPTLQVESPSQSGLNASMSKSCPSNWTCFRGLAMGTLGAVLTCSQALAGDGALEGVRHRILVSTDVGGTDPDDIQSMVHLLVYADCFDLEGLVSSPYGPGRKQDILDAIEAYAKDYPNLKAASGKYPEPDAFRAITKQGAIETPGHTGVAKATEGSQWIIKCARRKEERPLHVLVWGGIEDVAQALHDAPDILPKLRVYFIGGPNKKWSVDAYNYIEQNHPKLWMIEANSTYRGWFVGGNQEEEWGNKNFVKTHVAGHGTLGKHFVDAKKDLKMGDTPSVARLLRGVSGDPSRPSWGGRFVRIWKDRKTIFDRHTTASDKCEAFGVVEFVLPKSEGFTDEHSARMIFSKGRPPSQGADEGKALRFRFSPRDAKVWSYIIESDVPALTGQSGKFTAVLPLRDKTRQIAETHPNWWIDDPNPAAAEGLHSGAKSVSQWREDFLRDFAARMDRCAAGSN